MKTSTIAKMMKIAEAIADTLSKDPNRKVGALVVGTDGSPLSWGYNGLARGIADDSRLLDASIKLKIVVHAEQNAVLAAARKGISLDGGIMLTTLYPCINCANSIIQAGISTVICPEYLEADSKWWEQRYDSSRLFAEAGVEVILVDDKYNTPYKYNSP
jgi:dCMP deaminase